MKSWLPWYQRKQREADLERELRDHLELEAEEQQAAGVSREEATYAALREFGNVTRVKEDTRQVWTFVWLEQFWQDVRFGARTLVKSPGFTVVAVLTLALGMGANTAIFTLISSVLLRPLPYANPSRVVWITERMPEFSRDTVLCPEYAAWQQVKDTFERLGAIQVTRGVNLTGGEQPERIMAGHVDAGFFSVLGVPPMVGRTFVSEEGALGRDHVAVISNGLWQSYFRAQPDVLGKTVVLDGERYTVIGVMPRQFLHPDSSGEALWLPFRLSTEAARPASSMGFVDVLGRLKPGVGVKQAQAALEVATRHMDDQYPPPWSRYHAAAHVSVVPLAGWLSRGVRTPLCVLLGAVGLVLLIACANVANLQLARAVSRGKEVAVRTALGAGRARLVRQMLTESTLLALLGGGLGLFLVPALSAVLEFYVPGSAAAHPRIDVRVLAMTTICCLAAGMLFGLVPALTASKLHITETLKESAGQIGEARLHRFLRNSMVALQLALSIVLLVGAGLLVRSFLLLLRVRSGIDPHNVLTAEVLLPNGDVWGQPRQREFYRQVLERLRNTPGVQFAAATTETPFTMFNALGNGLRPEGQPEINLRYCPGIVTPDYFRAIGIRLLAGRFFDDRDAEGSTQVVILGQSLARGLFLHQDAIGRRVFFDEKWRTVVGVVEDTRHLGLSEDVTSELYTTYLQQPSGYMNMVIRTAGDPLNYVSALRDAVWSVDKDQPLWDVQTMEQRVSASLSAQRERLFLLGAFALLAILIAASGVYGVTAYSVTRRTHEIGVRVAIGAGRRDVLRMIMAQGLRVILVGVALGLAASLALSRALTSFLYHTAPHDPLTFAGASLLLLAVALSAVLIPARRATKVDPMVALRHE